MAGGCSDGNRSKRSLVPIVDHVALHQPGRAAVLHRPRARGQRDTALSAFVKRFKEDGVTNHNVKNHFGGSSSSNLVKSSSSSRTVRGWTSFEKTVWLRRGDDGPLVYFFGKPDEEGARAFLQFVGSMVPTSPRHEGWPLLANAERFAKLVRGSLYSHGNKLAADPDYHEWAVVERPSDAEMRIVGGSAWPEIVQLPAEDAFARPELRGWAMEGPPRLACTREVQCVYCAERYGRGG